MRQFLFLAASVVGFAVAAPVVLPSLMDSGVVESLSGPTSGVSVASEETSGHISGPRQNRYRADRNGHFLLNARMNHAYTDVLVDTGASLVAMRESDARRAGIRVKPSDFTMRIQTANGVSYAAPAVLNKVEIDDIAVFQVKIVVVPDDLLHVTLLGNSFLARLDRYEISGNVLTFEN